MVKETRKQSRKGRHTRKAGRYYSVESLHHSFETMENQIRMSVEKGCTDSALAACIRKNWIKHFHQHLSDEAIRGMISHYRSVYGVGKVGRKTRKAQRGGMAPMSWSMGPGSAAAVYGRFPTEMGTSAGAVSALDRFYESGISRACDATGGCNTLADQKGGRLSVQLQEVQKASAASQSGGGAASAFLSGHMPGSVPRNGLETLAGTIQGVSPIGNPPSDPTIPTWSPSSMVMGTYNPSSVTNLAAF
jgi:hypothetical protein